MTRDEQDKALLVAFAELTFGLSSAGAVKAADAFLAARQPPSEPYPPRSEPIGPPSVAACAGCLNRATYCHACYHAPALDQWLAARQPPGEPASGIYIPGPEGPIRVDTPCPECRDRPGRVAINGQEVPCNTCGRLWTPGAKETP